MQETEFRVSFWAIYHGRPPRGLISLVAMLRASSATIRFASQLDAGSSPRLRAGPELDALS